MAQEDFIVVTTPQPGDWYDDNGHKMVVDQYGFVGVYRHDTKYITEAINLVGQVEFCRDTVQA